MSALIFFAPTLLTFKSSLIGQTGKVENLKTNYIFVKVRGSHSIKSELVFTLNTTNSVYVIAENIGQSSYNKKFEILATKLDFSENATVWIKKSEKDEEKPKVFEITDRNGRVIYGFEESKFISKLLFFICFGFGIIFIMRHITNNIKN